MQQVSDALKAELVSKLVNHDLSVYEVAAQYHINPPTVYLWLREQGQLYHEAQRLTPEFLNLSGKAYYVVDHLETAASAALEAVVAEDTAAATVTPESTDSSTPVSAPAEAVTPAATMAFPTPETKISVLEDLSSKLGVATLTASERAAEEEAQAAAPEEAAAAEVPISPLVGARAAEGRSAAGTDYRQRLEDLDTQIERIQSEEQESNVYSSMTSAESELKMWESELNAIYSALLQALPEEEASELVQEQQEWMQNREARAAECTGKAGGSVENLGYAAALVSLTRDRAYELADRYDAAVS